MNESTMFNFDVNGTSCSVAEYHLLGRDKEKLQSKSQVYLKQWKRFFVRGDIVLDIGAYIGQMSLYFAVLGAKVHAFEGSPRNFGRLEEICKPFEQITIHKVALSNENSILDTRFNDSIDREHPTQRIRYVIFDDYGCGIENIKFVKIDIEGMESLALLGMNRIIDMRPIWQIEWHKEIPFVYDGYPGFVQSGFDFQEFVRLGYYLCDSNLSIIEVADMKIYQNYFIIPKEKYKRVNFI